jgi:hypothetical protein
MASLIGSLQLPECLKAATRCERKPHGLVTHNSIPAFPSCINATCRRACNQRQLGAMNCQNECHSLYR